MSCSYTSPQNGKAECIIRTINDTVRSLLFHASVPPYWAEALNTTTRILNILPTKTLNFSTLHFALFGCPPTYDHLRVFGCLCYPNLSATTPHKLSPRSTLCVFLGYSDHHKGYRCLDLHSNRVIFDETSFPFATHSSPPSVEAFEFLLDTNPIVPAPIGITHFSIPVGFSETTTLPRVATPAPLPPTPGTPPTSPGCSTALATAPGCRIVPAPGSSPGQAPNASLFLGPLQPIRAVLRHLHHLRTRPSQDIRRPLTMPLLVRLHSGSIISSTPGGLHCYFCSCVWVSITSSTPSPWGGSGLRGFSQRSDIDFDETFSPVVKPATVRTVLSLALSRNWPIHQLDAKNAFLHGTLSETVYCSQAFGFTDAAHPDFVCRLNRSLYGLNQAPRAWYNRFASFLLSLGFVEAKSDASLFVYHRKDDMVYLLLYVDDIVLTASTDVLLRRFITSLQQEFSMKDLGKLHHFLGMQVQHTVAGLFLSQRQYMIDILDRAGMAECKPYSTPVDVNPKLSGTIGNPVTDPTDFRSLAGAL
jgi:hypothetical protein